jgi:hypothetical protein
MKCYVLMRPDGVGEVFDTWLEDAIHKGEISLTDDNVSDFLDLVEGRLFSDDLTGEERRADSYSPRRP